jgi:hypothetical protein
MLGIVPYLSLARIIHSLNFRSVKTFGGCGVVQLGVRRLAIRHSRCQFSARHPGGVFPTELTSDMEIERNFGE